MRIGVIDIGYNAIRAAVYEDNIIGAREIFGSKFKNDILKLLSGDQLDIKHQVYLNIAYILNIFNKLNVTKYKCVATAVLRQNDRAEEFVQFIKNNYNIDIEIISGSQEALLTATGLLCGIPDANGIAADLGGGSLELAEVMDKIVGKKKSLELGTKIIAANNYNDLETLTTIISNEFDGETYKNLYLIGGALRFISKFYIDYSRYPLKNLHNLTIDLDDFLEYLNHLDQAKNVKNKFSKKRLNSNAILVVRAMIEIFQPTNIVVSTYGLKEGLRYEMLEKGEQSKDVIIEKLIHTNSYDSSKLSFKKYSGLLQSLLEENFDDFENLLLYSIILLSKKSNFDQTMPPTAMTENILSSEIQFKHKERVMLGLIFFYSLNFKIDQSLFKISKQILTPQENVIAQIIGCFLRICIEIDGPEFHTPSFSITKNAGFLGIDTSEILPRPIFENICDRLKSIALALKFLNYP